MSWRSSWILISVLGIPITAACASSPLDRVDEDRSGTAGAPAREPSSLVVSRADGTEVRMPAVAPYVWCGAFSEGTIDIPTEAVHIYLWPRLDPAYDGGPTGWFIRAVVEDIAPGEPLLVPTAEIDLGGATLTTTGVEIFAVADLEDFASTAASSSGAVVFESVPCVDGDETVAFDFDVILGAEDAGPGSVAIEGSFSGRLNEPPQRDLYWNYQP